LNLLQSKGANSRTLYLRSRFLDKLIPRLEGKEQSRLSFAQALKATKPDIVKDNLELALSTAREFFPFWVNDIKAIANFEKKHGFNIKAAEWEPKPKTLKALKNAADSNIFTNDEERVLDIYSEKMLRKMTDPSDVNLRTGYAKLILARLRDAPEKSHEVYRKAVELILKELKKNTEAELCLKIAREFYKCWRSSTIRYA